MFLKLELKHFSIIIAIAGIAFLYILSTLSQPINIDLNKVPKYEGKKIITTGRVVDYYQTKHGTQIITIKEQNVTAKIYLEGRVKVEYGDLVQASGTVEKYNNEWEIVVNNEKQVDIIQKWQNNIIPVEQVAAHPQTYQGLNINITGFVDLIYENYFFLTGNQKNYQLMVFYKDYNSTLQPGKKASVAGKLEYNQEQLRYCIETYDKHAVYSI